MKRCILHIIISVASGVFFAGCVTTSYERSDQLPLAGLFRTFADTDTTQTFATVPIDNFYSDPFLQQLIGEALDSNINVRLAINRLAQISEYLQQSRAAFFPTLNLGLNGSVSDVSKYGNSLKPANPYTELKLVATAGWEIDVWGKLSSAKRSQQAQYFQQEATVRAMQTQIVSNIASAYYQLIMLDRQRAVTEKSIESYTGYLQTVEELKKSAQVTEVAVLQAKSQLASAKAYLPQIDASIAMEENYICLLLGKTPTSVSRSSDFDLTLFHSETLSVGVPAQLLSNRPDVQAAEYALRSAHEQFNVASAAIAVRLSVSKL